MKVQGKNYRTVWMQDEKVMLIEQNLLPFEFRIFTSTNYKQTCQAISRMIVRGAGAIGATAGFAMAQACIEYNNDATKLIKARQEIENTRPTAQNLFSATKRVFTAAQKGKAKAIAEAQKIADEDVEACRLIGQYGKSLVEHELNVLTHCNAGWLAFVDFGTALSPVYQAWREGCKLHVWVDETRPRSQGARLTAWELQNEKIPHKIIADNSAAFLMEQGKIDVVITGADRITASGDVANKIGTLEKAICARYFDIPFYVAAPTSTIDIECENGNEIPIEIRSQDEIIFQKGVDKQGDMHTVKVCTPGSSGFNPAFDVTPASLISGIITEKGLIHPSEIRNIAG